MKLKNLLTEQNQSLYNIIKDRFKIHLKKQKKHDDKSWGSNITSENILEIYYCPTKNKIESFTHELLHASTQINGYKRLRGALSLNREFHYKLPRILSCLDNEFQHHKMYSKFIEMGYRLRIFLMILIQKLRPTL